MATHTTHPSAATVPRRPGAVVVVLVLLVAILAGPMPTAASAATSAERSADAWSDLASASPAARRGTAAEISPTRFRALTLDRDALGSVLDDAPGAPGAALSRAAPLTISIPAPDGDDRRFRIHRTAVLAPELAAEHPEIATYAGTGVDDPGATVRLDLTPRGFHASVRGPGGSWYVDPRYRDDQSVYASYRGEDLEDPHGTWTEAEVPHLTAAPRTPEALRPGGAGVVTRTYRLALVNDPAYASYHAGRGASVLAAKTTLINRVNQIYEDDLAIRLQLVAGSDTSLNLDTQAKMTEAGGPCGAQACYTPAQAAVCDVPTIARTTPVLNTLLAGSGGSGAYDVGHLVLGVGGGGIAYRPAVGSNANKGGGCTGVTTPVGDLFAVDYVAHELGHQFGGDHTFNGVNGSCSGNASGHGVEPGSGSTIMAYAGICGADDLQKHSDPYFSQRSIEQITTHVDGPASGVGQQTTTGGRAPIVTAPATATVPIGTPFALSGSATDADNDALVYLWEQNDAGTGTAFSAVRTNGPLFRVFGSASAVSSAERLNSPSAGHNTASASPIRTFPDLAQLAAGNVNRASNSCPSGTAAAVLECRSELLPTVSYAGPMHFRLTARDGTGGVASADTTVTVASGTGPFRVTGPSAGTVTGGSSVPVTWDVAGTTAAPVSAANVRITLSTDGGATFPTELLASTPNDGSQSVVVPNVASTTARFRVEAVGGVFFDVSPADVTITAAPGTSVPTVGKDAPAGGMRVQHTDALTPPVTVTATDPDSAGSTLTATANGLPNGLALAAGDPSGSGTAGSPGTRAWTVDGTVDDAPGTYPVTVAVTDGSGGTASTSFSVVVDPEDAAVTWATATQVASAPGASTAGVALRIDVAGALSGATDQTAGDVSRATATFRRTGSATPVCADVPVVAGAGTPGSGTASCQATLASGADHAFTVTVGGRYAGTTTGTVRVTATPAEPTPTTPSDPAPPTPTAPVTPADPATPVAPAPTPGTGSTLGPGARIPPVIATLRPQLTATAKRLRVSRAGRAPVRVACRSASVATAPATCSGTVRITARLGGRTRAVGSAGFRVRSGATATAQVRLTATARRLLRRATTATVTATSAKDLGALKATRRVTLVPRG